MGAFAILGKLQDTVHPIAAMLAQAANVAAFFARRTAEQRHKAAAAAAPQAAGGLRQQLGRAAVDHARAALQLSVLLSKVRSPFGGFFFFFFLFFLFFLVFVVVSFVVAVRMLGA